MTKTDTITLDELRGVDLFAGTADEDLQPWLDAIELLHTTPGENITDLNAGPRGLYLLLDGALDLLSEVDGRIEPASRQIAPTWIGAVSAITGEPLPVVIRATDECRVGLVPREAFVDLVFANRDVFTRIMQVMAPVMNRLSAQEANRERLASLGTMAAGLAHELNNPAAAAKRAASSLVDALNIVNHALETFVAAGIERADAAS